MKSRISGLVTTVGLITLSIICCLAHTHPVLASQAAVPSSSQALAILVSGADVDSVTEAIKLSGGKVIHVFPPAALIAEMPLDASPPAEVLAVYRQAVDGATLATLTDEARRAAQVWNALLAPVVPTASMQSLDTLEAELVGDALVPPPSQRMQASASNASPGYDETSEYLIGRVAVGIILPESDGSEDASTEDWTADERALVLSEITAALDWWANLEPRANLTFVYDDGTTAPITTGYEPISRHYNDQYLWVSEVMGKKGYTSYSYFDQVRHYNNDLRDRYDTDWAFTIFVVDSSSDSDNRFTDGFFAYAYLGGPFMVMTYGNNGYGPHNMDAVAAHEIGHIFLALDQYYTAQQPCARTAGYLDVENQNSQYGDGGESGGCASNVSSIMRGQTWPYRDGAIDTYARGQVGWRDSDSDGILDPVDTTLSVSSVDYVADAGRSDILTFTGLLQDDPFPSPKRRSVTINTIEQVQYRVAGGAWADAQPADGIFDTYAEAFTFTTPPLPSDDPPIDLRVVDSAGNERIQTIANEILDTTLTRLGQQVAGEYLTQIVYIGRGSSANSYVAGAYYCIDDGPWQPLTADDGAFDSADEDFTIILDLTTLSPGTHRIQAYSVDSEGNIETSPASDSLLVHPIPYHVFLPTVLTGQ